MKEVVTGWNERGRKGFGVSKTKVYNLPAVIWSS